MNSIQAILAEIDGMLGKFYREIIIQRLGVQRIWQ